MAVILSISPNARRLVRLASLAGAALALISSPRGVETIAADHAVNSFSERDRATAFPLADFASSLSTDSVYVTVGLLLLIGTAVFLGRRARKKHLQLQAAFEERVRSLEKANRELSALYQKTKAADQAKSAFLASVSREMRAPLNAIIGPAQLLQIDIVEERHASFLRMVQAAGEHLHQLIDEVMQYTSLGTPNFRPSPTQFNLRVRIEEIASSLRASAEGKGIRLNCVFEPSLAEARFGDPRLITQVIVNVVESSIKHTKSGTVCLAAKEDPSPDSSDCVRFEVSSTGLEISATESERMFEPFHHVDSTVERRLEGTGLGLAISRQLVELMNGRIGLRCETGGDAVFWFTLPLSEAPQREASDEESSVAAALDLESKKVLLVDDNHANIMVESAMLERMDLRIEVATNGQEAIEMASDSPYDLILMDLRMPGIGGVEAAARIRSHGPNSETPIVALSAYLSGQMIQQCEAAGINYYLSKPITCSELERTIGLCLHPS